MDLSRLFKVLVIGGAVLGCSDETTPTDASNAGPDAPSVDTSVQADSAAADTNADVPAVEGTLCFCPADCCEGGEPKAGIECCWSTSC